MAMQKVLAAKPKQATIIGHYCMYITKRHGRGSNPRSSVYETDALPLGHRACADELSAMTFLLISNQDTRTAGVRPLRGAVNHQVRTQSLLCDSLQQAEVTAFLE
ncbi:hypothetical protein Q8A73_016125 [Channa argus]|nr:hypothetical protein Q8A73_016125 [Channa argus]